MRNNELTRFEYWMDRHDEWLLLALIVAPWIAIYVGIAAIRLP
jgi:hypothetical protein